MTLTATQFIVRNITCKNSNVFLIYKKMPKSKRLQAFRVFFYCQTRSDRREQHSKNGGAPWLPEPCMENNDEHNPAQPTRIGSKISTKTPQNTQIYTKTAIGRSNASVRPHIQAVSVKKTDKRKRLTKAHSSLPKAQPPSRAPS